MDGTPDDSESETVAPVAYLAADSDVADPAKVIEAEKWAAYATRPQARARQTRRPLTRHHHRRWLAEDQEETCSSSPTNWRRAERIRQIEVKR